MNADLQSILGLSPGPIRDAAEQSGVAHVKSAGACPLLKEAATLLEDLWNIAKVKYKVNNKHECNKLLHEASILIMGVHDIFELLNNKREMVWVRKDTMAVVESIIQFLQKAKFEFPRIMKEERVSIAAAIFTTGRKSSDVSQLQFLRQDINDSTFTFLCLPIEINLNKHRHLLYRTPMRTVVEIQLKRKVLSLEREIQNLTVENENLKKREKLDEKRGNSSNRRHKSRHTRGRKDDSQSESEGKHVQNNSTAGESGQVERTGVTSRSGRRPPPDYEPDQASSSAYHVRVPGGGFFMNNVGNYYDNNIVVSRTHNAYS